MRLRIVFPNFVDRSSSNFLAWLNLEEMPWDSVTSTNNTTNAFINYINPFYHISRNFVQMQGSRQYAYQSCLYWWDYRVPLCRWGFHKSVSFDSMDFCEILLGVGYEVYLWFLIWVLLVSSNFVAIRVFPSPK